MPPYLISAEAWHGRVIGSYIRQIDADEIRASLGLAPRTGIDFSLNSSLWAKTMMDRVGPFAMFGLARLDSVTGCPWMIGTARVARHGSFVMRTCREWFPVMLDAYPRLVNYVSIDNAVSIRWLKRCGCKLEGPVELRGSFFYRFHLTREMLQCVPL